MIDERQRHALIDSFITSHGEEVAMTLAETLFTVDLASKDDVDELGRELRKDLASKDDLAKLGRELRKDLASKDDLAKLGRELRRDLASKDDLAGYATKVQLERALRAQLVWFISVMLGVVAIATTIIVAAVQAAVP